MSELYWISVINKLNTLFWLGFAVSIFSILINFILYANSYSYEEDDRALYKKIIKLSVIVMTICGLCGVITPGKNEAYVIYGVGSVVDYCKDNSNAKEIPDKAIDALNRYLDTINEDKKDNIK